jgi:hypothetical protein
MLSRHGGKLTMVLRIPGHKWPDWVEHSDTKVGSVQGDLTYGADEPNDHEFGFAWYRMFALGLKEGWFSGHPYEVMPGGLNGVEQALKKLKEGKASAVKYVFRISETPGIASRSDVT